MSQDPQIVDISQSIQDNNNALNLLVAKAYGIKYSNKLSDPPNIDHYKKTLDPNRPPKNQAELEQRRLNDIGYIKRVIKDYKAKIIREYGEKDAFKPNAPLNPFNNFLLSTTADNFDNLPLSTSLTLVQDLAKSHKTYREFNKSLADKIIAESLPSIIKAGKAGIELTGLIVLATLVLAELATRASLLTAGAIAYGAFKSIKAITHGILKKQTFTKHLFATFAGPDEKPYAEAPPGIIKNIADALKKNTLYSVPIFEGAISAIFNPPKTIEYLYKKARNSLTKSTTSNGNNFTKYPKNRSVENLLDEDLKPKEISKPQESQMLRLFREQILSRFEKYFPSSKIVEGAPSQAPGIEHPAIAENTSELIDKARSRKAINELRAETFKNNLEAFFEEIKNDKLLREFLDSKYYTSKKNETETPRKIDYRREVKEFITEKEELDDFRNDFENFKKNKSEQAQTPPPAPPVSPPPPASPPPAEAPPAPAPTAETPPPPTTPPAPPAQSTQSATPTTSIPKLPSWVMSKKPSPAPSDPKNGGSLSLTRSQSPSSQ